VRTKQVIYWPNCKPEKAPHHFISRKNP